MLIERMEHEYDNFTLDIRDVEIEKNSINGLVGKNGAGKTTFMEILAGYKKANKSYIVENTDEKDVLFIPSDISLYEYLTVKEFLDFVVKYSDTEIDGEFLLSKLAMKDKRDTLIEELSLGMRKKLTLVPIFVKKYSTIILIENGHIKKHIKDSISIKSLESEIFE